MIPEPDDQKAHRRRRGSRAGRPVSYDKNAHRGRNVIERAFNGFKHGAALRLDTTSTPSSIEAVSSWPPPSSGSPT